MTKKWVNEKLIKKLNKLNILKDKNNVIQQL